MASEGSVEGGGAALESQAGQESEARVEGGEQPPDGGAGTAAEGGSGEGGGDDAPDSSVGGSASIEIGRAHV